MLKLIAPKTMLECEKAWFTASGIPSIHIMERAATCLAELLIRRYSDVRRIYFACGPGGNGGDGYACARILHDHAGMDCTIIRTAPAASEDCIKNAGLAEKCGIPILDTDAAAGLPAPEVWVDCIYGTGLSRAPSGAAAFLIRRILRDRTRGSRVIACDIPSGLDGKTGKAYEPTVCADVTAALHFAKFGHFLADGLDLCGDIDIPDIGFPDEAFPADLPTLLDPEDLHPMFFARARNIHKNRCGHLMIIAGSFGMAGAAALCAKAALRSGAGLVSIACPASIVNVLQTIAPCAMCIPLPETDGAIADEAAEIILRSINGKTALAIGPGLRRSASVRVLRTVLESGLPAVIDADALNILSENRELLPLLQKHHILTPHPGEAARLLGHAITDPIDDSKELSSLGASVILKGASRVIRSDTECYISASGCSGMARGGSGDILTGIIGALIAEPSKRTAAESAVCACEIHGISGVLAQEKYGNHAMNAADICEFLPEAFKRYAD